MAIELRIAPGGTRIELDSFRLVIAGYTGRDAHAVALHIHELAEHGIPAPESTPAFYELPTDLLVVGPRIVSTNPTSSGEAEPVLMRTQGGELYVGIGSDQTDREVERTSILESKRACPKIVGRDVWPFERVRPSWDELVLSSTIDGDPYQRGVLSSLRRPEDVLALVPEDDGSDPLVLFLGTVPLLDGAFRFGGSFAAALSNPGDGSELTCAYRF